MINDGVLFWVTQVDLPEPHHARLWGIASDQDWGLQKSGKGLAPLDLTFVGRHETFTLKGAKLGQGHQSRRGSFLSVEGEGLKLPAQTPFLMCSNVNMRVIFDGEVSVQGAGVMAEVIRDLNAPEEFLVGCEEWIGAVTLPAPHQGLYGRLIAFSDNLASHVSGQKLRHLDRDMVFGSVNVR